MWIEYNPNPLALRVGDCVIRAISKALNQSWEKTYVDLCVQGFMMGDLASSNAVWSAYLTKHKGFRRYTVQDCPDCYTVEDFCLEHPNGVYVIGTGSHAVCVCEGCYYDAWQSGKETPVYYFEKEI
jgi:hypothetical protein